MSLICIGAVSVSADEKSYFIKQLYYISQQYGGGVFLNLDFNEPVVENISKEALKFSVAESPNWDNCDKLLLPDNWYYNGMLPSVPFTSRMEYLYDIAQIFTSSNHTVKFYIATSGTPFDEYDMVYLRQDQFQHELNRLVGNRSGDISICFIVE